MCRPPRRPWRRHPARAWRALASAAVLVAAACASGRSAAPDPSVTTTTTLVTNVDGLAATLEQYRSDVVIHQIAVQVVHRGARAVRLSRLRLVWPGLEPVPPSTRSDLVSPGQILDLPMDFGESVCASPPTGDEAPPAAAAVVEAAATWDDSGEVTAVRIPVTDTRGVLARVYPPSCRRQSVTDVARLSWDPSWTEVTSADGRPTLAGALRLDRPPDGRRNDEPVRVTMLSGSVLLTLTTTPSAGGEPLLTLAAGAASARLPVVFAQSGNCAPHALAESKQTFLLTVRAVVANRGEVALDVIPDDASKDRLTAMINRSCGLG